LGLQNISGFHIVGENWERNAKGYREQID